MTRTAVVTGAGGFIGWHLVRYLKARGYYVIGVDIKKPTFEPSQADEFRLLDLRYYGNAVSAVRHHDGVDEVYGLAADMGGMGFITSHDATIMHDNILINMNTLEAARAHRRGRYFFSSSACVYPNRPLGKPDLREEDAYPALPDNEYGWEKLYFERVCMAYARDYDMVTRIARFHNTYGENGTWRGGREKAPAALCRKVAEAKRRGETFIEVWGDGSAVRSYTYIDDTVEGIYRLMQSDYGYPLNIGSDQAVSVNELVDIIADVAGIAVEKRYVSGPVGVTARNSDNALCRRVLGWAPATTLRDGITRLYPWVEAQVERTGL